MFDEPQPPAESTTAESHATDASPNRDGSDQPERSAAPDRTGRQEPDRATDPPPDRTGRSGADCECDHGAGDGVDESDAGDAHEYRLERLRLLRTVVTLAVVVGRLIRSL